MAKWFKEHLIFKSNKGPPQPPKPDYRLRSAGQPDILAAYKLQKERDFEDPYTGSRGCGTPAPGCGASSCPLPNPVKKGAAEVRYISPKHRLIKVENPEKNCGKSPGSPEDQQGKVIILEDYADPFDAQAGQEKVVGNDGYMEPYEAQRMMAEIRRRGSKDASNKPLPLYDTPYEPTENGGDSDAERVPCHRPRESRLPEDDERPPGEYDQPWEWKKGRISKAFAVQFDEADSTRQSPPKEEKVWHHNRLSGSNLKSLKQQSVELGEKVEADLPLVSQTWYHGAISRTDAENLLRLCKEASYLVRNSETTKNDYSLSLKSNQGFMHMKLTRTKESKYILGLNSPPFDSVPEVIHYYSSRKLPIKGAEHMSLLYPVAIRTL